MLRQCCGEGLIVFTLTGLLILLTATAGLPGGDHATAGVEAVENLPAPAQGPPFDLESAGAQLPARFVTEP
jgi:hypothetical protein